MFRKFILKRVLLNKEYQMDFTKEFEELSGKNILLSIPKKFDSENNEWSKLRAEHLKQKIKRIDDVIQNIKNEYEDLPYFTKKTSKLSDEELHIHDGRIRLLVTKHRVTNLIKSFMSNNKRTNRDYRIIWGGNTEQLEKLYNSLVKEKIINGETEKEKFLSNFIVDGEEVSKQYELNYIQIITKTSIMHYIIGKLMT